MVIRLLVNFLGKNLRLPVVQSTSCKVMLIELLTLLHLCSRNLKYEEWLYESEHIEEEEELDRRL